MSELSFRQKAANQAAEQKRFNTAQVDARTPFSLVVGKVTISLRVCVGRPFYRGADGVEHRCEGDQTLIVLAMSNPAGSPTMRYEGWSAEHSGTTLSDDLSTRYTRVLTSRGLESWVGQVNGSRTLEAERTFTDVLVFSPPHPSASKLMLELPRSNWGMKGVLRLDIPKGRVMNFPAML